MSSLKVKHRARFSQARSRRLAGALGVAALAAALGWPQVAAAVGRTEPAAQMREQPIRGQELRRQLLEHYGLDRGATGPGGEPADPATVAPGLAPSIAPTIPPAPTAVKVPAINPVLDPASALPVAPDAALPGPSALPGGGPLTDRPIASPANAAVLPTIDAATVAPVGKMRLSEDERLLLREQLRRLPRRGVIATD